MEITVQCAELLEWGAEVTRSSWPFQISCEIEKAVPLPSI